MSVLLQIPDRVNTKPHTAESRWSEYNETQPFLEFTISHADAFLVSVFYNRKRTNVHFVKKVLLKRYKESQIQITDDKDYPYFVYRFCSTPVSETNVSRGHLPGLTPGMRNSANLNTFYRRELGPLVIMQITLNTTGPVQNCVCEFDLNMSENKQIAGLQLTAYADDDFMVTTQNFNENAHYAKHGVGFTFKLHGQFLGYIQRYLDWRQSEAKLAPIFDEP
ncbi:hypothetical protein CYMTET_48676 [Cymbomonas tetramitiformis]|uniref:Uncharacterized protein n=1 Tax=Cymbomonas tetramitiformis TaxID=36881 RepID=A0AAE0BT10_9CHLO|nr:hypothetical protein CYMTET_48676 [Cymbomonas tetramitiformis]